MSGSSIESLPTGHRSRLPRAPSESPHPKDQEAPIPDLPREQTSTSRPHPSPPTLLHRPSTPDRCPWSPQSRQAVPRPSAQSSSTRQRWWNRQLRNSHMRRAANRRRRNRSHASTSSPTSSQLSASPIIAWPHDLSAPGGLGTPPGLHAIRADARPLSRCPRVRLGQHPGDLPGGHRGDRLVHGRVHFGDEAGLRFSTSLGPDDRGHLADPTRPATTAPVASCTSFDRPNRPGRPTASWSDECHRTTGKVTSRASETSGFRALRTSAEQQIWPALPTCRMRRSARDQGASSTDSSMTRPKPTS